MIIYHKRKEIGPAKNFLLAIFISFSHVSLYSFENTLIKETFSTLLWLSYTTYLFLFPFPISILVTIMGIYAIKMFTSCAIKMFTSCDLHVCCFLSYRNLCYANFSRIRHPLCMHVVL